MKRLRAELVRLSAAVAALFALSIAAPRAGLFYHEHSGGTQAHVHPDEGVIAELLGEYAHTHDHGATHHHPHDVASQHHATVCPGDPIAEQSAFEHDDGPVTGHWHEDQRFHRAVIAKAPLVVVALRVVAAPDPVPAVSTHVAALDLHARAPPRSPLS